MAWIHGMYYWVLQYYHYYSDDDFVVTMTILQQGQIWSDHDHFYSKVKYWKMLEHKIS